MVYTSSEVKSVNWSEVSRSFHEFCGRLILNFVGTQNIIRGILPLLCSLLIQFITCVGRYIPEGFLDESSFCACSFTSNLSLNEFPRKIVTVKVACRLLAQTQRVLHQKILVRYTDSENLLLRFVSHNSLQLHFNPRPLNITLA